MRYLRIGLLVFIFAAWCSAGQKMNVLFIMSDDLNCDLGCYGHRLVKSPNIDRLASRGVRFERAYCQYPVCNPSRASLMTGLYPQQTRVLNNATYFRDTVPDVVTMPQLFEKQGYTAARIGKIYHYGVPNDIGMFGLDDARSWSIVVNPRGRDKDEEGKIFSITPGRGLGGTLSWMAAEGEDREQTDGIGADRAIGLLEQFKDRPLGTAQGKPFFLAVGFYRPHPPYVAPKKYFDMYPLDSIQLPQEPADDRADIPPVALADRPDQLEMSDETKKKAIQAYYASITFMDAQLGRVLDALDRLGLRDQTIVVFVSDHGYHLGHHGLWQKQDLFEGSARVPLIVVDPRIKTAGRSTAAITELVDLYPTLADLCGLPRPGHLMGQSLRPVLKDPTEPGKEAAYTVANAGGRRPKEASKERILGYTIRTERYRYTQWGEDGRYGVELYDYENDPGEFINLATHPDHAGVLATMTKILMDTKMHTSR